MPRNTTKLNSLMFILNQLDSHKRVIASQLAERLGVSDRTIYRYIISLQDAGYPIYFDRTDITYRFADGYSFSKVDSKSELRKAIDLQSRIFGATKIGLLTYDSSGGCVEANDAAASLLSTSREKLLKQNYFELESWKSSGLLLMALEVMSTGNERTSEFNVLTTFDKNVWIKCGMSQFKLNAGNYLLLSVQDISERKKLEFALKESEERFKQILENAPIGMAVVSLNGKFMLVNQALCEIVGYEKSELEKLTFQDITHPDDLSADLENVRKMLEGSIKTYSMKKRYIRKDRQMVCIQLSVSMARNSFEIPQYFISQIQELVIHRIN